MSKATIYDSGIQAIDLFMSGGGAPPDPTVFWTQGNGGPWFLDATAPDAGTTRVRHKFRMRVPGSVENSSDSKIVIMQDAVGFTIVLTTNAGVTNLIVDGIKDSDGLGVTPADTTIWVGTRDIWVEIEVYADQVAQELWFSINGATPVVRPFTAVGSGSFMTSPRKFAWMARNNGGSALYEGVQFEYIQTWFTVGGVETSRRRIEGNAATVNAMTVKQGADAT